MPPPSWSHPEGDLSRKSDIPVSKDLSQSLFYIFGLCHPAILKSGLSRGLQSCFCSQWFSLGHLRRLHSSWFDIKAEKSLFLGESGMGGSEAKPPRVLRGTLSPAAAQAASPFPGTEVHSSPPNTIFPALFTALSLTV